MTNLVYGINPLVISNVEVFKARRYGKHPIYHKFRKKKHPVLSLFFPFENSGDGWKRPYVIIRGANGGHLKTIMCKTTDECFSIKEYIENHISETIQDMKV